MIKAYQPLHHKYRPKRFDELIGQEPIATTLKQALISNRIAPAYIFSGPRGTGKTSSARIFAKSLNCLNYQNATTEPCNKCELCKAISAGNALDIIEIDAASNTGVENIRELIERSRFAPVQARWKVYVIDECHMLSTAAFNALLKTLEEPPPRVVFILATTDPQRVLPTILSRCMRFDFRRIALNDLKKHLANIATKEGILIDEEALLLIAKRSQGGLRDAESMLDQLSLLPSPIKTSTIFNLIGAVPEEELIRLATALTHKDPKLILNTCRELLEIGKEPIAILQGIASILRDLVITKISDKPSDLCNISQEHNQSILSLANEIKLEHILSLQSKLKGSESQIRNSIQPRLWLEILLLGLLSEQNSEPQKNIDKFIINKRNTAYSHDKSIQNQPEEKTSSLTKEVLIDETIEKENQTSKNINLDEAWNKVLAMLELPSTKMLLSQQAKLASLNHDSAEITISEKWINMIASRKNLIEEAFKKALGSPKKIILIKQLEEVYSPKEKIIAEESKLKNNLQANQNIQKEKDIEKSTQKVSKDRKQDLNTNSQDINGKSIDKQAKQLADFFNGEVVNLE